MRYSGLNNIAITGAKNCALVDVRDCSCFDKEEIIHRNFDAIMKREKKSWNIAKNIAVLVVLRMIYAIVILISTNQRSLIPI